MAEGTVQVAQRIGIDPRSLTRYLVKHKTLRPTSRVGFSYVWTQAEIDRLIEFRSGPNNKGGRPKGSAHGVSPQSVEATPQSYAPRAFDQERPIPQVRSGGYELENDDEKRAWFLSLTMSERLDIVLTVLNMAQSVSGWRRKEKMPDVPISGSIQVFAAEQGQVRRHWWDSAERAWRTESSLRSGHRDPGDAE